MLSKDSSVLKMLILLVLKDTFLCSPASRNQYKQANVVRSKTAERFESCLETG